MAGNSLLSRIIQPHCKRKEKKKKREREEEKNLNGDYVVR